MEHLNGYSTGCGLFKGMSSFTHLYEFLCSAEHKRR